MAPKKVKTGYLSRVWKITLKIESLHVARGGEAGHLQKLDCVFRSHNSLLRTYTVVCGWASGGLP
jgi:hypothetical protein